MENIDLTTLDWISAIGWSLIGILFQKSWIFPHGTTSFSLTRWINENLIDVIRGLLLTLVVVKLGDIVFQVLFFVGIDLRGISEAIKEVGVDPIQLSLIVAIAAQYLLYKRKQKRQR